MALVGLALGLFAVVCAVLINPYVLFFGPFLVVPPMIGVALAAPIIRSRLWGELSDKASWTLAFGAMVSAFVLPILADYCETRVRGVPIAIPMDAQDVRISGMAGESRIEFFSFMEPARLEQALAHAAQDEGWSLLATRENSITFIKGRSEPHDLLLITLHPIDDGTTVRLFVRVPARSPVMLLITVTLAYILLFCKARLSGRLYKD
ncbi:MAG: hypothetical protein GJ676_07675 [Rhodobacteraceae bacterium]|nr:hypothetical protein [Paracoccaceae bacterium]